MSAVAMKSFGFGEQLVRVVDREGDPWFVGKDVCSALELNNHHQAMGRLDEDEKSGVITNDPHGREQETAVVSESGVFSLIFTSRKASAKQFRKWVTSEVLPALRRTGRYEMPPAANDDAGAAPKTMALGTPHDLARLDLALRAVREARMLFGAERAVHIWEQVGLPLPPKIAPLAVRTMAAAMPDKGEGPLWAWAAHVGLTSSRKTTQSGAMLHQAYVEWCAAMGFEAATFESFMRGMKLGYGEDEIEGLFKVETTRRR